MSGFLQYNVLKEAVHSLGSRLGQMLKRSEKMSAAKWRQIFEKKIIALAAGLN